MFRENLEGMVDIDVEDQDGGPEKDLVSEGATDQNPNSDQVIVEPFFQLYTFRSDQNIVNIGRRKCHGLKNSKRFIFIDGANSANAD